MIPKLTHEAVAAPAAADDKGKGKQTNTPPFQVKCARCQCVVPRPLPHIPAKGEVVKLNPLPQIPKGQVVKT